MTAIRPDLVLILQEDDDRLRAAGGAIFKRNNRSLDYLEGKVGPNLASRLAELIEVHQPAVLCLADARLGPEIVIEALSATPPRQIFLYGRLLEAHREELTRFDELLATLGYVQGYGF